jgi:hypothetical protein
MNLDAILFPFPETEIAAKTGASISDVPMPQAEGQSAMPSSTC